MFERISPSERRGVAAVFATACLAFLAWAFPNMSQIVTIPGAVACAVLAFYFLWPEIKQLLSGHGWHRREQSGDNVPALTSDDIAYNVALGAAVVAWIAAFLKGRKIAFAFALIATAAIGLDFWMLPRGFVLFQRTSGPFTWVPSRRW
jgi:hypothetical protein